MGGNGGRLIFRSAVGSKGAEEVSSLPTCCQFFSASGGRFKSSKVQNYVLAGKWMSLDLALQGLRRGWCHGIGNTLLESYKLISLPYLAWVC